LAGDIDWFSCGADRRDQGKSRRWPTFIFALVGALLVAVLLSPILSFHFLPKRFNEHEGRAEGWLKRIYLPALTWVLRQRVLTLGIAAALVLVTGIVTLRLGGEFLPRMGEGSIVASVVRLAGVSIEESVAYNTTGSAGEREVPRRGASRLEPPGERRGGHRPDGDRIDRHLHDVAPA
jgi:hypothetical protein